MMAFIPFLLVLAGLTLLFSRRRYKAIEQKELPRVVVKGHTFSDSVENTPAETRKGFKVENVRQCCIVGAGRVGAVTGIVLASQNPHVQFYLVDDDVRLIDGWKSDKIPIFEPGLEGLMFDDDPVALVERESQCTEDTTSVQDPSRGPLSGSQKRQRKLANLTFSTDIHAGIAPADLVFLCLETQTALFDNETTKPDLSRLESTIQAIAHVSTGHKIIVQKTTAPCGIVQEIKKRLRNIASPTASFDVLSNPEFIVPGTAVQDFLYPPRVIIGHIYSEDMSPQALTALKRLYIPWVPEDRIITMDAWSSEVGKIAANALIAQQIASLNSISALCECTGADVRQVSDMAGFPPLMGCGKTWSLTEVQCLVYLARELGLQQVAEYWRCVLRMEEFHHRRIAGRVVACLSGDLSERKIALLGITTELPTALSFIRELRRSGVTVNTYDGRASSQQIESGLRLIDTQWEGITVAESLETACAGCSAVVVHAAWDGFPGDDSRWQEIANSMEEPRVFFDPAGAVDRSKMRQLGFEMLQSGVRGQEVL
ncbi:hypothetical protein ARAM_003762 [Aspergillus rambellii]|uniref:UDP-glucose 6-dehydrogenase n=1 Tax=Aspergillus rambellii TaxID=308745 RepID=A0A0F8UB30_9EURO|nr:hypothetical protein ARAM_003762 [Aspergillus rambellii]